MIDRHRQTGRERKERETGRENEPRHTELRSEKQYPIKGLRPALCPRHKLNWQ